MGHYLLNNESCLRCIEAQGAGQPLTDPIWKPFQRLSNPLALLEGASSDLFSRHKLAAAGIKVVLGDRFFQGL